MSTELMKFWAFVGKSFHVSSPQKFSSHFSKKKNRFCFDHDSSIIIELIFFSFYRILGIKKSLNGVYNELWVQYQWVWKKSD